MNHCKICGNNLPAQKYTCEEAGYADVCHSPKPESKVTPYNRKSEFELTDAEKEQKAQSRTEPESECQVCGNKITELYQHLACERLKLMERETQPESEWADFDKEYDSILRELDTRMGWENTTDFANGCRDRIKAYITANYLPKKAVREAIEGKLEEIPLMNYEEDDYNAGCIHTLDDLLSTLFGKE